MNIGTILPDIHERLSVVKSTLGVLLAWKEKGRYAPSLEIYVRAETHADLALGLLWTADGLNKRPTVAELVQALYVQSPDTYNELRARIGAMEAELLGEQDAETIEAFGRESER